MSIHKQQHKESLSAFLDAEQSDDETSRIVDALLNDPVYKDHYIRLHITNEYLHNQVRTDVLNTDLRNNISLALDDLPGHFMDDAVSLQTVKTENITQSSWFNQFIQNRMLSGVSIAASVMFITFFTLQEVDLNSDITNTTADNLLTDKTQISSSLNQPILTTSMPSLIQSSSELPASYVSSSSSTIQTDHNNKKQQYQWIEADSVLSQQVRQYVKEHETHRAAYNLQPQIRTATYQISN